MSAAALDTPGELVRTEDMANAVRALARDAVQPARPGQPGLWIGMATATTVLFTRFLKFDAVAPDWPDRDRFVLSAGHGSTLLYALLHLSGTPGITTDELRRFRQWGALTPGHPQYRQTPGVEATTGPLGQGLATAVGMAIAERMMRARFGRDLVDHHTYVLCGDGCLMEGISHEAISLAGHLCLRRLIVLFDDNRSPSDSSASLACSDDHLGRFAAAGWAVYQVDGQDQHAVAAALAEARQDDRPVLIACHTTIEHSLAVGGEGTAARERLDWPHGPFEIPEPIRAAWRAAGARSADERQAWEARLGQEDSSVRAFFREAVPADASAALQNLRSRWLAERPSLASCQASQRVLDAVADAMPNLVGGAADLTHSTLTQAKSQRAVTPDDFRGSYIHYGVREHAMAAAMNGIALHSGLVPYGGAFLASSDYARPAIRLAALMGLRVIHVMTHDSIGLGEDGPAHQPVEHLASLRAIPNLHVLRPADAVETVSAWALALESSQTPSVLCLSRQVLPPLPRPEGVTDGVRLGAYVLREPEDERDVTLIGTGSEVTVALEAADALAAEGIRAAVVSAPCFSVFREQPPAYRRAVLGDAPRVGVEAAVEGDWARWLGADGAFVGMTGFGASAPAEILYERFGITGSTVADLARRLVAARSTKH